MSTVAAVTAAMALLTLAIWIYLVLARGGFWRCLERDDRDLPRTDPSSWPRVVAVIPARNEADMIPRTLASLLQQDYPGAFSIVLVDDKSEDDTLAVAHAMAAKASSRLAIVQGSAPPRGWSGKLWALNQGIDQARVRFEAPDYLLLTDADIEYERGVLRDLVRRAEARGLVLVSLMAKLRCRSLAERTLIPAFIFFFQMLYPFAWVNRRDAKTAAAAGGCMLVLRSALDRAGGTASVRGALIDDCALAARLKEQGPIWLGLTERVTSVRPYAAFGDIRRMVTRSAYAQLRFSPLLLVATITGLALAYLAAPTIALFGSGSIRWLGAAAWTLMAFAFWPTLRFYGMSPLWSTSLPAVAAIYLVFTVDSALQYALGRGGLWKGRVQALPSDDI